VSLPGRIVWRDGRGATRFATIRTRDVNDCWAAVECLSGTASIPLYRLVHLQIEHAAQRRSELPRSLRHGKVLSAVYRVAPSSERTGVPTGYLLRLLNVPGCEAAEGPVASVDDEAEAPRVARSIA
jgi:hypothetical protein